MIFSVITYASDVWAGSLTLGDQMNFSFLPGLTQTLQYNHKWQPANALLRYDLKTASSTTITSIDDIDCQGG